MARVAVIEPDDDPAPRASFTPSAADRETLLAALFGARLEVREERGELLARIASRRPTLDPVLRSLRRRLGPPA